MIRGYTLIALVVVLGLARVLSEKRPESKSVLVDIDSNADEALDNMDETESNDDDHPAKPLSDPFWNSNRSRRRRRYRSRRPYPNRRPYPIQKPHTAAKACSTSRPTDIQWNNDWHGQFLFECPKGSSITYIKSVFRDCQYDRIWNFGCGNNEAAKEYCHWSHGYTNDPKDGIFFYCPNNGFVSGVESIYTNGDRRYKFKCCNDERFNHADCHQSHHLNKAGEDFEFKVERDKRFYITGIASCFNSEKRDRAWVIDYCRSEAKKVYQQKKDSIEN